MFKASDVYLQRVQKKEPGFGLRLHRIGDDELGGNSIEDSPDNFLKQLKPVLLDIPRVRTAIVPPEQVCGCGSHHARMRG